VVPNPALIKKGEFTYSGAKGWSGAAWDDFGKGWIETFR
jgi:hypothetical protein